MNINKLKLAVILVIIFFLIFSVCTIIGFIRHANFSQYNVSGMLPSDYKLSKEDSDLISKKWRSRLKVEEVYLSKQRPSLSQLISDDNRYRLFIYKMELKKNFVFDDSINVKFSNSRETIGVEYRITGRSFFFMLYKGGVITPISKIYLTLGGDSIKSVHKNGNLVSYNLVCHNLSIRYSEKEPVDIAFLPKEYSDDSKPDSVHLDVLFLKRNNVVYLLLMAPTNPRETIDPELLGKIVTGDNE